MKLLIVLAVVGLSSCAKLDRTYLPPHAQTSGGSGNFLQAPGSGPSESGFGDVFNQGSNGNNQGSNDFNQDSNGFNQGSNGFNEAKNNFAPSNGFSQNGNGFAQAGNDYPQSGNNYQENDYSQNANFVDNNPGLGNGNDLPERPQAAYERNAAILRQDSQNDGETYSYSYETENGIFAEENGVATNGVEAQGGFSYTGDDGQVYSIRYTADQNGFVPQGDHIPTPPPVPEEILKALEQNARDEAAGIFDDGSYQEGKYGDDDVNQYNGNGNNNYGSDNGNFGNNNNFANNGNANSFGSDNRNNANSNGNQNFNGNSVNEAVVTNSAAYLPPFENHRPAGNSGFARNQFAGQPSGPETSGNFGAASANYRAPPGNFGAQPSRSFLSQPSTNFAPQPSANFAPQPSANFAPQSSANFAPQSSANFAPQSSANFAPQSSANFAPQSSENFSPSNGITGVTNAYLPPRDQPRGPARSNTQNGPQRSSNFGSRSSPRRPSFNAKDGYQY